MKRKLTNMIRTTFTDVETADIKHEQKVDRDSQVKMANAKKAWLMDYQEEREGRVNEGRPQLLATCPCRSVRQDGFQRRGLAIQDFAIRIREFGGILQMPIINTLTMEHQKD